LYEDWKQIGKVFLRFASNCSPSYCDFYIALGIPGKKSPFTIVRRLFLPLLAIEESVKLIWFI
jgi:hypothetical protein